MNKLSESTVQKEIEGSRDKIEAETNQKVEHFCYPFGTRNEVGEREFKIAKKCRFKTSTTTNAGNIFPEHKNLLEQLPRIPINQKRDYFYILGNFTVVRPLSFKNTLSLLFTLSMMSVVLFVNPSVGK